MNTSEFLDLVHGPNAVVHFRCLGAGPPVQLKGTYTAHAQALSDLNQQGYDIYFVVNGGGTRNADITGINAVWVDLDVGKNLDGSLKAMNSVTEYKEAKLSQLRQLPAPPSLLVETRNGLHGYWLLEAGCSPSQFSLIMNGLCQRLDSDPKVKRLANLMRLPGYDWRKAAHGEAAFPVQVLGAAGCRYSVDLLLQECSPASEIKQLSEDGKSSQNGDGPPTGQPDGTGTEAEHGAGNSQGYLESLPIACAVFNKPSGAAPDSSSGSASGSGMITLPSWDHALEWLKTQNPSILLGSSSKAMRCPFHNDKSSSFSVFRVPSTGHYLLTCHANTCHFGTGDLIQYMESRHNLGHRAAVMKLLELYGGKLIEAEWAQHERQRLESNLTLIASLDLASTPHKALRHRIHWSRSLLEILHAEAAKHIYTEQVALPDGRAVFFASTRHLAEQAKCPTSRVTERTALLVRLGLLEKLNDGQIPLPLRERAEAARQKQRQRTRATYYALPTYSDALLSQAEDNAKEMAARGFTIPSLRWDAIADSDGEAAADAVFPQSERQRRSPALTKEIEEAAAQLLENQEYLTKSQVLKQLGWVKSYQRYRFRSLFPIVVKRLGLVSVQSHQDLCKQYGYVGKGWPVFWVRAKNDSAGATKVTSAIVPAAMEESSAAPG